MRNIIKLIVLPAIIFMALLPTNAALATPQSENLTAYAELIRAQGDYAKALAEAQLFYAKAELTRAQAAHEWQRVRALTLVVDRLELEFRRLRRDEAKVRRQAERIEDHARAANLIMAGNVNARSLRALRYLQINVIDPSITAEAMRAPVPAISAEEFAADSSNAEIIGFAGGNVGQLIHHLQQNRLTVAAWGEAHTLLVDAVVTLSGGAQDRLAELDAKLAELANQVNPPEDVTQPVQGVN